MGKEHIHYTSFFYWDILYSNIKNATGIQKKKLGGNQVHALTYFHCRNNERRERGGGGKLRFPSPHHAAGMPFWILNKQGLQTLAFLSLKMSKNVLMNVVFFDIVFF